MRAMREMFRACGPGGGADERCCWRWFRRWPLAQQPEGAAPAAQAAERRAGGEANLVLPDLGQWTSAATTAGPC